MIIPFFSIDLKFYDLLKIFFCIIYPFNKNKLKEKLLQKLKFRFPNKNIVLLPSARLGFYLTLKKYFIEGDEVIFSAMSFPLYVKIAKQLKLKVILVDVEKETLNINYLKIEEKINSKTKGIVATHLFGYPCKILEISDLAKKHNLKLIEDCAQSFNSFYKKQETGTFGDVGIFSTSLLKIPTTLGGGILITEDKNLSEFINKWCEEKLKNNFFINLKQLLKNFLSILNSYPFIYKILGSKIFSFLHEYNPMIYRKILYSGMGMQQKIFNPLERPKLKKYQLMTGILQINRCIEMNNKRKENTLKLIQGLSKISNFKTLSTYDENEWNYQYHILITKNNLDTISEKIFNKGIHVMKENVWDCTKYGFAVENLNDDLSVTKNLNCKLLRIQNNSYLNEKQILKIIDIIALSSQ